MKSMHCSSWIVAASLAIAALQATPAAAQRVFVAAQGSDSNPCTFALPCRTFQHAHDAVAAGGEIDVLDPAGYGVLTINKAISIQGHGFAGISVGSGGTGITVNAPNIVIAPAQGFVNLNGLLIDGAGVGQTGILFTAGSSLSIENCVIRNMTNRGIDVTTTTSVTQTLSVSNSYISNNANEGIYFSPGGSGAVTASIERTVLHGNVGGVYVTGQTGTGALTVAVTDSVADNGGSGFQVFGAAGHSATNLVLTRAQAVANQSGLEVTGTNGTAWLSQSAITGNAGHGFNVSGSGVAMSFGDNYFAANGTNLGSLTGAAKQ
jgi:nitrous oxidase accessory protein NosD